ncbi:hypothetical protein [Arthrobacter sp. StoSoilB22]|uniref:hypothetical protein n=1 Tax=Arthrobacter sp. StoSoilB22 TaxID=2830996 RepID=UPI001CC52C1D|nr:hypothetical protein [Arthrobacter sp. StoSoilB22]BCW61853.1 hypothetical protein StoSoilB22_08260 [Arthrobacter sp. StoSoilB22]
MSKPFPHGIDITAPGGLTALFAYRRAQFGDAVMRVNPDADPQTPPPPAPVTDPTPGDPAGDDDEPLRAEGLKALKAERARADAEAAKAAKLQKDLDDIEAAKLSDIEKAQREAKANAERATELEKTNARLVAIAEHSVPKKYQHLVYGTDANSYAESAKAIAELAAAAEGKAPKNDPVPPSGNRSGGGNAAGGSLAAGRELYEQKHKKTS